MKIIHKEYNKPKYDLLKDRNVKKFRNPLRELHDRFFKDSQKKISDDSDDK
jgi:hypothetical protein